MEAEQREVFVWMWEFGGVLREEGERQNLTSVAEGRAICAGVKKGHGLAPCKVTTGQLR